MSWATLAFMTLDLDGVRHQVGLLNSSGRYSPPGGGLIVPGARQRWFADAPREPDTDIDEFRFTIEPTAYPALERRYLNNENGLADKVARHAPSHLLTELVEELVLEERSRIFSAEDAQAFFVEGGLLTQLELERLIAR